MLQLGYQTSVSAAAVPAHCDAVGRSRDAP